MTRGGWFSCVWTSRVKCNGVWGALESGTGTAGFVRSFTTPTPNTVLLVAEYTQCCLGISRSLWFYSYIFGTTDTVCFRIATITNNMNCSEVGKDILSIHKRYKDCLISDRNEWMHLDFLFQTLSSQVAWFEGMKMTTGVTTSAPNLLNSFEKTVLAITIRQGGKLEEWIPIVLCRIVDEHRTDAY